MVVTATALFGHPEDPNAFEEYYAITHVPLAQKIPNLQRYERATIFATPDGSDPPYYRIAALYFEDMEQLQQSLASEEGQATVGDVQNFATGGATFYFSEVDS